MAVIKKSANNKCWIGYGGNEMFVNCCVTVAQLYPILCDPMDCEIVWRYPNKLKIELLYYPVMDIYIYISRKK